MSVLSLRARQGIRAGLFWRTAPRSPSSSPPPPHSSPVRQLIMRLHLLVPAFAALGMVAAEQQQKSCPPGISYIECVKVSACYACPSTMQSLTLARPSLLPANSTRLRHASPSNLKRHFTWLAESASSNATRSTSRHFNARSTKVVTRSVSLSNST